MNNFSCDKFRHIPTLFERLEVQFGRKLGDPQIVDREQFVSVGPIAVGTPPCFARQGVKTVDCVLMGILGMDGFPCLKFKYMFVEVHRLIALAHQVHLDATGFGFPPCVVGKSIEVEIGAESSRFIWRRILRLNSAVIPAASLYSGA